MERILYELKNTADKVAKKSTELVELSKIKLNILNTKSAIDNNFKVLGELLYNSQNEESNITSENLEEIIAKIDDLYEKLADFEEASAILGKKKLCPNCKKTIANNAQFCSACGYDFDE